MGSEILVSDEIEAGAEFLRDFDANWPVSVAFWVVLADSESSFLYVASDKINDQHIDAAYREVANKLSAKTSPWLSPYQVKLVNTSDPIAHDALTKRDRYGSNLPTRINSSSLGGTSIDTAYVYPATFNVKTTP